MDPPMKTLLTKHAVPAGAATACLLLALTALAGWGLHSPALIGAGIFNVPAQVKFPEISLLCSRSSAPPS